MTLALPGTPAATGAPVILAPMAGVTTAAYRSLCRRFGAAVLVGEMVNARGLVERNARSLRMVGREPGAVHHSVQLYGSDPADVAAAVRLLVDDIGVDHIDLNFGCPVPKVTRKGGGAALPARRALFAAIVTAAVAAASQGTDPTPVTVKLRIGLDDGRRTFLEAGRIAEEAGAAAVALHARTAQQRYSGRADWSAIAQLKDAIGSIPVYGNGDIWQPSDALAMVEQTGCDGVVIGRGCLGRPWLFRDLDDAFAGRAVAAPPTLGEVLDTMTTHARLLVDDHGEPTGVRSWRRHVAWYLTGLPVGGDARRALVGASTLGEVLAAVALTADRGDPTARPDPEVAAMPRGHAGGPGRVVVPEGWCDDPDDPNPVRRQ